jgi:hypothetical protein
MKITLLICRYLLAALLVFFGVLGLVEFLGHGYDPSNEQINLFGNSFKQFFNAMMATAYLPVTIRLIEVASGVLLFTKRYWFIGALLHLPIAVNILLIHLFLDIPMAHTWFFIAGMVVSIPNIILVVLEWKRLKTLIISTSET